MKIADRLAVAKDIFSMITLICVAAWAVYGTWVKKEERIADSRVLELQQKTSMRSSLLSEMTIQKLPAAEDTVLSISVRLENIGNEEVRATLDDRAILVSKIEFEDKNVVYKNPTYIGSSRYKGLTTLVGSFIDVGPGERYEISYIHRITEPGIYLVRFLSIMQGDSVEHNRLKNFEEGSMMAYSTGVDTVLTVE